MNQQKRILCMLLAVLMIVSLLPMQSFAQENPSTESNQVTLEDTASALLEEDLRSRNTIDTEDIEELHQSTEQKNYIVTLNANHDHFEERLGAVHHQVMNERVSTASTRNASRLEQPEILFEYDTLLDGYAVKMTAEEAGKVANLPEVESVVEDIIYTIPETWVNENTQMFSSNDMIGSQTAWDTGYDGKGQLIAVIDSGANVDHPDFKLTSTEGAKYPTKDSADAKISELRLPGQYYNEKIVYAYNYRETNNRIKENTNDSHGQHVAGTVAANGDRVKGVAPEAQLMVMRVFDESGTTSSMYYIAAMEHAVKMGASSLNMSLGSPSGDVKMVDAGVISAIDKAVDSGVIVNIAAGNEGQFGYTKANPRATNPDFGIVGTPALAPFSLAVASVENDKTEMRTILKADDTTISYRVESDHEPQEFLQKEVVYVGYGAEEEYEGKDVEGKLALISRGNGITFTEKVERAAEKGAIAAILFNNEPGAGFVNMGGVDGLDIMTLQVPANLAPLLMDNPVVDVLTPMEVVDSISKGKMSDFSNWGLTPDGDLKPEITAPGGNIVSLGNEGYVNMSGTSMATPHLAGATAVMNERMDDAFPNITGRDRYYTMKNLMMSTAKPHVDTDGLYTSIRKQGAGVLNLAAATQSEVYAYNTDGITKIMLGDVGTSLDLSATLKNLGQDDLTYKAKVVAITDLVENGAMTLKTETIGEYEGTEITVPAGSEVTYSQTIDISAKDAELLEKMPKGYHAEGWIFFEAVDGGHPNLVIPFHGFRGDWDHLPVVEDFVYNYDLDKDQPTYFEVTNTNSAGNVVPGYNYTGLTTNYGSSNIFIGESSRTGDGRQAFEDVIGISPNGDGYFDYAEFRGVFLRNHKDGKVRIYKEGGTTPIYESYAYSLYTKKNHHSGQDRWPMAFSYRDWKWDGRANYRTVEDGSYVFEFAVKSYHGSQPESTISVPMIVDQTPPTINLKWDEETGILTANIIDELAGVYKVELKDHLGNVIEPNEDGTYDLGVDAQLSSYTITALDALMNKNAANVLALVEDGTLGTLNVSVSMSDGSAVPKHDVIITDEEGMTYPAGQQLPMGTYTVKIENLPVGHTVEPESIVVTLSEEEPNQTVNFLVTKKLTYNFTLSVGNHSILNGQSLQVTAKNKEDGSTYELLPGYLPNWYDGVLPGGDYSISIVAPEGFLVTPNPLEVTVKQNYQIERVTIAQGSGGSVKPIIVNEDNLDLSDVTFVLENLDGNKVDIDSVLGYETYIIYPENVPEGVLVQPPLTTFEVTRSNPNVEVEFTFTSIGDATGSIKPTLKMFDESYPDYDIQFEISDFNGNVMTDWDNLPLGNYLVGLINLPTEYYGIEEPVLVSLTEDGQHQDVTITVKRKLDNQVMSKLDINVTDLSYTTRELTIYFTGSDGTTYSYDWNASQFLHDIEMPHDIYYVTVGDLPSSIYVGTPYVENIPRSFDFKQYLQTIDLTIRRGPNPMPTGDVEVVIEGTENPDEVVYEIRDKENNLIPVTENLMPGEYVVWVIKSPEGEAPVERKIPFTVKSNQTVAVTINFGEAPDDPIIDEELFPVEVYVRGAVFYTGTPITYKAVAEDGTEYVLEAINSYNSNFKAELPAGTYTIIGTIGDGWVLDPNPMENVVVKAGMRTIYVDAKQATTGPTTIVSSDLVNLNLAEGEDLEANLPETVKVTLNDKTTTELPVVWDLASYDEETGMIEGDFNLEGTDITNPDNVRATLKVTFGEVVETYPVEVYILGSYSYNGEPITYKAVAEDGTEYEILRKNQYSSSYLADLPAGTYTFIGTIGEGFILDPNPMEKTIVQSARLQSFNVYVKVAPVEADLSIVSSDLVNLNLAEGEDLEANLPETVKVTLSDGTTKELPVTWDLASFDEETGMIYGDFDLEGTEITNPENIRASLQVTFTEPGEETYEVTVMTFNYYTYLPDHLSFKAVAEDGTTFEFTQDGSFFDAELPMGNYEIIGEISEGFYLDPNSTQLVVDGNSPSYTIYFTIKETEEEPEPALTVVSAEELTLELEEGEDLEGNLPETVTITLSDDSHVLVDVNWNLDSYNEETGVMTGTLLIPENLNVTNPDGVEAMITVTWIKAEEPETFVVAFVEEFDPITVEGPVTLDELNLPSEVEVTLLDGSKVLVPTIWTSDSFNGEEEGTYIFEGELQLPENYENPEGILATMEVRVMMEEEVEEALEIAQFEVYPTFELQKGQNPENYLPKAIGAYLSDGTKIYLPVTWSLEDSSKEGSTTKNIYVGTVQLPEDGSILNSQDLKLEQIVLIKDVVKPNPEIIVVPTPTPEPKPETPEVSEVVFERIFGANRYETAMMISSKLARKSGVVVIASGENFPDALAGTVLAEDMNAPLLLTKSNELPMETAFEAYRLGAKRAILLGGEQAISKNVENKLIEQGLSVTRMSGKTRHETAALIAKEVGTSQEAILTTAYNYPDALSIGAYAAKEQSPILLTDVNELNAVTKDALKDLGVNSVIILGGEKVVSKAVEEEVKAMGIEVKRIAGETRYHTNVQIHENFYKNATEMVLSTGQNFADALTGSILAASNDSGVVLTMKDEIPAVTRTYLMNSNVKSMDVLGGELAISESVISALKALLQ